MAEDWRTKKPNNWPENERLGLAEIMADEGYRPTPDGKGMSAYYDPRGFVTKGVGHLVKGAKRREDLAGDLVSGMDMSLEEGQALLAKDYIKHRRAATRAPGWKNASPLQQRAITNLTFNLGPNWWLPKKREGKVSLAVGAGGKNMYVDSAGRKVKGGWPGYATAAMAGDYELAADELVNSKWYGQVGTKPGQRGYEVVAQFRPRREEERRVASVLPGQWMSDPIGRTRLK